MSADGPVVVGAGGVQLRTVAHGPVRAPAVVLQHGIGSSRLFLAEAVVGPLVAAGWRVVAAPLRGHAGSVPLPDPADQTLALMAADVAALVTATGAVACGGVSVGGHAAVAAVAAGSLDPAPRVVAALPAWTGTAAAGEGPHAAVAAEVRAVGVRGMWLRLARDEALRPWLRRVLLRDLALHDETSLAAALVALDGGQAPTAADVAALPPGCGVVGWEPDPGHPLEVAHRWAMTAPDARLVTLHLDDLDEDPQALGHAVASALGPPPG